MGNCPGFVLHTAAPWTQIGVVQFYIFVWVKGSSTGAYDYRTGVYDYIWCHSNLTNVMSPILIRIYAEVTCKI